MSWSLKTAIARGDRCAITYTRTIQNDEGDDVEETRVVHHDRVSFEDTPQTDAEWQTNIRGEIVADLSGLNPSRPDPVDITNLVR